MCYNLNRSGRSGSAEVIGERPAGLPNWMKEPMRLRSELAATKRAYSREWSANLSLKTPAHDQVRKNIKNEGCSQYVIENKDPVSDKVSPAQYLSESKGFIRFANI